MRKVGFTIEAHATVLFMPGDSRHCALVDLRCARPDDDPFVSVVPASCLEELASPCTQEHARASLDKCPRNREAEPLVRAGDERRASLESLHALTVRPTVT